MFKPLPHQREEKKDYITTRKCVRCLRAGWAEQGGGEDGWGERGKTKTCLQYFFCQLLLLLLLVLLGHWSLDLLFSHWLGLPDLLFSHWLGLPDGIPRESGGTETCMIKTFVCEGHGGSTAGLSSSPLGF